MLISIRHNAPSVTPGKVVLLQATYQEADYLAREMKCQQAQSMLRCTQSPAIRYVASWVKYLLACRISGPFTASNFVASDNHGLDMLRFFEFEWLELASCP